VFILILGDMFQAVLITKSEKESKMHQISIPEAEIRSILYQHYQQRQVVSGQSFITAETETDPTGASVQTELVFQYKIYNFGSYIFFVCFLSLS
jgi:hypothetical protein